MDQFEKENTSRNPWTYHRAAGIFKVPRHYIKKWRQNSHRAFRKTHRDVQYENTSEQDTNLSREKVRHKDMRDGWLARQDIDAGNKRIICPKSRLKMCGEKQNRVTQAFIINSYRHKERKMEIHTDWVFNEPIPSQISKFVTRNRVFPESIEQYDEVEDLSTLFMEKNDY